MPPRDHATSDIDTDLRAVKIISHHDVVVAHVDLIPNVSTHTVEKSMNSVTRSDTYVTNRNKKLSCR